MKHTLGCLIFICGLLMASVFAVGACESITRHRAVQIDAQERTEQVKIAEIEATKRTRITVDGNIEIAQIQANAEKETDFTYIIFYMIRAGLWLIVVGVITWLVLLAIDWYQYRRVS